MLNPAVLTIPPSIIPAVAPPPDIVTSYQTSANDTTDLTTYTFATQAIGTASADRYVLVCTATRGTAITVSSMTIGGVSAALVRRQQNGNNTLEWWIALVPTGTTASIVVTWSAGALRCSIGVWALTGLQSTTATANAVDITLSGNDLSLSINVSAGGACFAAAFDPGVKTFTWAGLTERFDIATEAQQFSGASLDFAAAQTGLTVTATESVTTGTTEPILSAIALR